MLCLSTLMELVTEDCHTALVKSNLSISLLESEKKKEE